MMSVHGGGIVVPDGDSFGRTTGSPAAGRPPPFCVAVRQKKKKRKGPTQKNEKKFTNESGLW